jgi:hypothetical protein
MKRILSIRLAPLFGLLPVMFAGCCKKIEKIPNDVSSLCSIQWITTPKYAGGTDTLHFSYDNHGDLTTISRQETSAIFGGNYTFWYDHNHRLTDLIATTALPAATGNTFSTWHKYYYTGGRIALDSFFIQGVIAGARPSGFQGYPSHLQTVSYYQYDAQGRIKQATDLTPATFTQTQYFTYGGTGNLTRIMQVSGYITTPTSDTTIAIFPIGDGKINVDRTIPIFQFLNRNYSENNQFMADAYNEAGLPTIVPLQTNPYLGVLKQYTEFGFLQLNNPITIQYSCQMSGPGYGHGY